MTIAARVGGVICPSVVPDAVAPARATSSSSPPSPSSELFSARKISDVVVDRMGLNLGDPEYGEVKFSDRINGGSDVLITGGRYQYVGYYDGDRNLCLGRRKLPPSSSDNDAHRGDGDDNDVGGGGGEWDIIRFDDYKMEHNDSHRSVSVGICPSDGTVHLSFDQHASDLRYRRSVPGLARDADDCDDEEGGEGGGGRDEIPWKQSSFGPVRDHLIRDDKRRKQKTVRRVTYPRFIQTPDGGLQLCYREGGSGNGRRILVDYLPRDDEDDDEDNVRGGEWSNPRRIDSSQGEYREDDGHVSTSRGSYPNGYTYGPPPPMTTTAAATDATCPSDAATTTTTTATALHVTWVWRESSKGCNHDLQYAYSDDGGISWRNGYGEKLSSPPGIDSPGVIAAPIPLKYGLMNMARQDVDSRGNIHVVLCRCDDETLSKQAGGGGGGGGKTERKNPFGPPGARRYYHYFRRPTDADSNHWEARVIPTGGKVGNRPKLYVHRIRDDGDAEGAGGDHRGDNLVLTFCRGGRLVIMYATSGNDYNDWSVLREERGPFQNEMSADSRLWMTSGVLSVFAQRKENKGSDPPYKPTPIRVLDFVFRRKKGGRDDEPRRRRHDVVDNDDDDGVDDEDDEEEDYAPLDEL